MVELKKSLSLFDTTILSIGNIIGAGVFLLLGSIIRYGSSNIVPIFIVAAVFNLIAGLAYGELGSMYQSNAVEIKTIEDAMGKNIAFISTIILFGFLIISISTLAIMFGTYFTDNKTCQLGVSFILVTILSIINYFGIEGSKIITDVFGSIKLIVLFIIITVGVFYIKFQSIIPKKTIEFTPFVVTTFLAIFLFNGYDAIVKMTDEMKNPSKDIPRSLFLSILICSVIYILIAIIALSLKITAFRPINEIAETLFKIPFTGNLIYFIGLITILNTTFISMLALSRFIYGLSKEKFMPDVLSTVNEKYRTPHYSILVVFIIASVLLLINNFELSAIFTNICLVLFLLIFYTTLIILRIKKPDVERPFKIPFNIKNIPIPIVIGIVMVIFYITQIPKMISFVP